MDTLLLIVIGGLLLYILYLEVRLAFTQPRIVVAMPSSTPDQESGLGCAAVILIVLIAVIALALLGLLPPLG